MELKITTLEGKAAGDAAASGAKAEAKPAEGAPENKEGA